MPRIFRKFLWVSVFAHLATFYFIYSSPGWHRLIPEREHKVRWVRLSKGRAAKPSVSSFKKAKGMPYWTIREQKMALTQRTKNKKGKDKKSFKSPKKKKKLSTHKRFSKDGAVSIKRPKGKRERTIEDALARMQSQLEQRDVELEAAQIEKEGEGQSPDGSLSVLEGEVDALLASYVSSIIRKVKKEWIVLPKNYEEGESLIAEISVELDGQGRVSSLDYYRRSGDTSYDLSAKRAVERASPFPSPPEEIRSEIIREGILIRFKPQSIRQI